MAVSHFECAVWYVINPICPNFPVFVGIRSYWVVPWELCTENVPLYFNYLFMQTCIAVLQEENTVNNNDNVNVQFPLSWHFRSQSTSPQITSKYVCHCDATTSSNCCCCFFCKHRQSRSRKWNWASVWWIRRVVVAASGQRIYRRSWCGMERFRLQHRCWTPTHFILPVRLPVWLPHFSRPHDWKVCAFPFQALRPWSPKRMMTVLINSPLSRKRQTRIDGSAFVAIIFLAKVFT